MRLPGLSVAFAPACLVLSGCGSAGAGATGTGAGDASAGGEPVADAAVADGGAVTNGGAAPNGSGTEEGVACTQGVLSLYVTMQTTPLGRSPLKLYVPATVQAGPALFELDTGSTHTFLHEPLQDGGTTSPGDQTHDAGTVVIGCDTLSLIGLGIAPGAAVDGKAVAGTFGDDRLFTTSFQLDLVNDRVVWKQPGTPFPDTTSWVSAPYDRPFSYVRVHDVALDGTSLQLLVDTGSPDSIWLGQQGQPGDTEIDGEDANGDTIKMYLGTATLTLGGSSARTIPVLRVPSFPYLEQLVSSLGGDLNGLFGLSAFTKGIVFDTDAKQVRIAP